MASPEEWPQSTHDAYWWLQFTHSNLQYYATNSIPSNQVAFVVITSADGHGAYAMVVRRQGVPPYRIPPLHHPEWYGSETRLESDAAVDYLCEATALTWPEILQQSDVGILSRGPNLFNLAFCSSTNRVVGFKALKSKSCHLPDMDKLEFMKERMKGNSSIDESPNL